MTARLSRRGRTALGVTMLLVLPFFTLLILMHLTRQADGYGGWDLPILLIATAMGGAGLAIIPGHGRIRAIAALVIVPVLFFTLIAFAIYYGCSAFEQCL